MLNAQTEENDFIETDMTTTDVMSYKPQLDQDEAFDYLYDMFYNLPTGEDVKKNLLIVFDGKQTDGSYKGWNTEATLTLDHFDSVAEKIYFSFSINSIERGTVTTQDGVPTFAKAE